MEGKEILLQILNGSAVTSSLALAESLKEEISEGEELLALYDKKEYLQFANRVCSLERLFNLCLSYIEDDNDSVLLRRKVLAIKTSSLTISDYVLSDKEISELSKIIVLLKKVIGDLHDKVTLITNSSITSDDVIRIKEKLSREEIFTPDDILLTERIVKCANPSNGDINWDKVITYLNEYNGGKLKKLGEDKLRGRLLERANFKNPDEDIFKHHDMMKSTFKPVCKIEEHEVRQSVKEVMASIGFDFDKFDKISADKLLKCDLDSLSKRAKYLYDNGYIDIIGSNNYLGVCEVLSGVSLEEFIDIIKVLKEYYKFTDEDVKSLLKRGTVIFTKDGFDNFKHNMDILREYNVSNSVVVTRGILFLINDYMKNKRLIAKLPDGVSVTDFLSENIGVLYDSERVLNNLDSFSLYGFSLSDDKGAYSVLTTFDLAGVLDQFIELGISEHVHSGNKELKGIKDLMVRRIFYAFKNGLSVWESKDSYSLINGTPCLKEDEIIPLISDYPILMYLEEGHRLAIYSDTTYAQIKRKTEFVFDRIVISRLKTYRVFDSLVRAGVKPEEAIVKALTFNLPLEESEEKSILRMLHLGNEVKKL